MVLSCVSLLGTAHTICGVGGSDLVGAPSTISFHHPHSANRHNAGGAGVGTGSLHDKQTGYSRACKRHAQLSISALKGHCSNEIPQAANRVVGVLGAGLRAADLLWVGV